MLWKRDAKHPESAYSYFLKSSPNSSATLCWPDKSLFSSNMRQVLRAAKCASLRWSSDAHRRWKAGQVLPRSASTRFISLSLCRVTTPTQLMCVDEQRIPFPGQSPSRKYLQSKPNPVSPKDFVLATPQSLVLDFKIYTGKENVPAKCQKEIGWS